MGKQIELVAPGASERGDGFFTKSSKYCGNYDSVVFWKYNRCGEKAVGSISHVSASGKDKARYNNMGCTRNDDARSLHINEWLPSRAEIWVSTLVICMREGNEILLEASMTQMKNKQKRKKNYCKKHYADYFFFTK